MTIQIKHFLFLRERSEIVKHQICIKKIWLAWLGESKKIIYPFNLNFQIKVTVSVTRNINIRIIEIILYNTNFLINNVYII